MPPNDESIQLTVTFWGFRARFSAALRAFIFRYAIVVYRHRIDRGEPVSDRLLRVLSYGWGNRGFRARVEYLQRAIQFAMQSGDAILECGSGLSTLLVGYAALRQGKRQYVALEHIEQWYARTKEGLVRLRVADEVELQHRRLITYADCDWYEIDAALRARRFDLVLCDGPPSSTRGGRVGLAQLFGDALSGDCEVLLDDAQRSGEKTTLKQWRAIREIRTLEAGSDWVHLGFCPMKEDSVWQTGV